VGCLHKCLCFIPLTTAQEEEYYKIFRWIDNNEVLLVSNIHDGNENIVRNRKKPRQTAVNRRHLLPVWGSQAVVPICIPGVIDDYNHWMGGVDKADQLIASYEINLRCRRTWMPIFFRCFDIIRVNSYVIAKKRKMFTDQKDFILMWIDALSTRAQFDAYQVTRNAVAVMKSPTGPPGKRQRISNKNPCLPEYRFHGNKEDHMAIIAKSQGRCRYCSYLHALAKLDGNPIPDVVRPVRMCSYCKDHLCVQHFDEYHTKR
jgi:Transposase IS4